MVFALVARFIRAPSRRLDEAARNRWVQLMDRALDETGLPPEAVQVLRPFFHDVATFLRNT